MKTAVIYARQSYGVEEGSASLDVQVEACKKWAKQNNATIIGIFQDANTSSELYPYCAEGIEAASHDRGFQRWKKEQLTKGRKEFKFELGNCFELISAKKPDYICLYTSNRLGRSASNSNLNNFMTSYLMDYNCSIVDVQSNSVMDFSDKLMMAFRAMKDALDYQGVAEKRRASIESVTRRINSHKVYSNAYGVIMDAGIVKFDSQKAEVVKFVFNAMLEGSSYNGILTALNRDFRALAIGKQWYTTNVYHILENIVYCGYSRDREGNIDKAINIPAPIISYSQWAEVQRIVNERKEKAVKYNTRGEGKHWLPYSGLLYCECGRKLQLIIDKHKINYHCINGGDAENSHTSRLRVDDAFIKSIQPLFMLSAIEAERELFNLRSVHNESDSIRAKISAAEQALKAKMRMIETDEDFELFKEEISNKKQEIKNLKNQLLESEAKQEKDVDAFAEAITSDFQAISSGLLDKITYQRLLNKTIEKITVYNDKINIVLKDGNNVEIPRILLNRRGRGEGSKTLPESNVTLYIKPSGLHTTHITFGDAESYEEIKGEGYIIRVAK